MDIKEYYKLYYIINRDKIKEINKSYNEKNKESIRNKQKEYYLINRDKIIEQNKKYYKTYYENNRENIRNKQKEYQNKRKIDKNITYTIDDINVIKEKIIISFN